MNPHVEEIEKNTVAWLDASGMIDTADQMASYEEAKYGWLGARTYPYATRDLCQLVTDWCVWLFAFDDAFCEQDRHAGEIARALPQLFAILDDLDGREKSDSPFANALQDVKSRIEFFANADQLDRWRNMTKDYLFAQVWEAANRQDGVVPTLGDYIFMRRRTGAMLTVFALIDVAAGERLSSDEWRHPDVRAITEHANDVVVWDNDLISYAKERAGVNVGNNLVRVLVRRRRCSIQAAMDLIGKMRDAAVGGMVALKPQLMALKSPAVDAYVRGLEYWISGSIDYSVTSSRYVPAWPTGTRLPPSAV